MSNLQPNSSTPVPKALERIVEKFGKKVDSFDFNNSSPSFDATESTSEEIISISSETTVDVQQQTASFHSENLEVPQKDDTNLTTAAHQTPNNATTPSSSKETTKVINHSITCTEEEINLLDNCLVLRSGKIINRRRSKSVGHKNLDIESKNKNCDLKNYFGDNKSPYSINTITCNMANLTVIAQISNNVPFLWGEETPDLLQEVNNFVRCCENILDCFGEETDKQTFIKFIPTKLRGRAARLLEGIECRGFNDIKSALYNKLVNTKPYIIQLNELRLCKQYPNETVKCFGERINAMLKLCKQKAREKHTGDITLIEADLEETAVFAFKAGLFNPTYRLLIWQDTENNLTKLISKLNQIEESENQISTRI